MTITTPPRRDDGAGPRRIQRKRTAGWTMPPNTVYVGRPTKWGNPWRIGVNRCTGHGLSYRQETVTDAITAVRFFRDMLHAPDCIYPNEDQIKRNLRGKNLACWCPLDQPCHADVLLELANPDLRVTATADDAAAIPRDPTPDPEG